MASTLGFSITPSCTIILAPQIFLPSGSKSAGLSSAGWKMNFTLPGSSSFMPASTRPWPSGWRCACRGRRRASRPLLAQVGALGLGRAKGRSTCSFTGSASMSARSATTGPGLPPLQHGDHAGHGHAGLHLHAQRAQMVGHQLGGARFLVAQFRMLVDVAAPGDGACPRWPWRAGRSARPAPHRARASAAPGCQARLARQADQARCAARASGARRNRMLRWRMKVSSVGLRVALVVVNVCPLTCYWPPSLPERRRVVARCYRCLRIGVLNSGP